MPLVSFEGIEVDVPTALTGIQFSFSNGKLSIDCHNFTGQIVLSKPMNAPLALSDFPAVVSHTTTIMSTPASTSTSISPLRSVSTSTGMLMAMHSNKRSNMDDVDFSTDSDSDAQHKRLRSSLDQDADRSLLLTQIESASQQSAQSSSMEVESLIVPSSVGSPENQEAVTSTSTKTPTKGGNKTRKSPQRAQQTNKFFSPESNESGSRKTPESASKRRGSKSTGKTDPQQASIRDMMMSQPRTQPKPKAVATTSTALEPLHAEWTMVEASGAIPSARWGHTTTRISENRVILYGGTDDDERTLGDLHVFDLVKRAWTQPLNCEKAPRVWHDTVYLDSKHLLLVFGGERTTSDDELDVLSDIMVLDTECFLWYPPAISGNGPTARSGHTCTAIDDDIVVFGGNRGRSRQNTVHVLDTETWNWKNVKVEGKIPSARTYHTGVAVGETIVYFGGNDTKASFNSVDVLQRNNDGSKWTWFHPCVVGAPPCGRTGHSASLLDDGKRILVFGGWDPQTERPPASTVMNDAFVLNTETWEWEQVYIETNETDEKLPARVGHQSVLLDGGNTLFLFGGQDMQERRLNEIHSLTLTKHTKTTTSQALA